MTSAYRRVNILLTKINLGVCKSPLSSQSKLVTLPQRNKDKHNKALLSTQTQIDSSTINPLLSRDEIIDLSTTYHNVIDDFTVNQSDVVQINTYLRNMLEYNFGYNLNNAGVLCLAAYKMLEHPENITDEKIRLAKIMTCYSTMFNDSMTLTNDLKNGKNVRNGKPCWSKIESVGLKAINDSLFVQAALYPEIKKNFERYPYYLSTIELFNFCRMKSTKGLIMQSFLKNDGKPDLNLFTKDILETTSEYVNGYVSFQQPLELALFMANIYDPHLHKHVNDFAMGLATFREAEKDYLDCFGAKDGQYGESIREGKLSWLAVTALENANSTHRSLMERHYGQPSEDSQKIILDLYKELNLSNLYDQYKKERFDQLCGRVQAMDKRLNQEYFFRAIDHFYDNKVEL